MARGVGEVVTSNFLAVLTAEALTAECVAAANSPACDPEGNLALLKEARRRKASGAFDDQLLQMLEVALSPESVNLRVLAALGDHDAKLMSALEGLRGRVAATRPEYLFHGTLKSRLIGISREGLLPAKHPKDWGPEVSSEHLASGVFFSADWRPATDWMLFRANGQSAKGAVLRLPAAGLKPEKDEFATSPGCFIVRGRAVDASRAHVLLAPFAATNKWLTLSEAIEVCRPRRKPRHR